MSIQAYVALTAIVSTNAELLISNRNDLLMHDRKRLLGESCRIAPERFGWIVNACSTHLISENAGVEYHHVFAEAFDPTTGSNRTSTDEFYLWDGETLYSVAYDVMFAMVGQWRDELASAA